MLSDYFIKEFAYLEIQEFLLVYHQQTISLSAIKRHLNKLNLFKRPVERIRTDDATLSGGGSNIRYRRVWVHLRKTGLKFLQEDARQAILQYDPDGVSRRRRRKLRRRKWRTRLLLAYWWPWQAKTVWFFIACFRSKPFGLK